MKLIPLTQGQFAQVDDEDYELLNKIKWCAQKDDHTYYAVGRVFRGGTYKLTKMHRLIMGCMDSIDIQVDHKDCIGTNNQRENLRICTNTENRRNVISYKIGTSKYKGVYWHKGNKSWYVHIRVNGIRIFLGTSKDEDHAARIYDTASKKYHGEFSRPNFSD